MEACHGVKDLDFWSLRFNIWMPPETDSPLSARCEKSNFLSVVLVCFVTTAGISNGAADDGSSERTYLSDGWVIQSSAKIQASAETISSLAFKPVDWYKATVPSTVVGNLVDDMVYPDPFFGMNLRSIPGMAYPVGTNFSNKAMPSDSPFKVSWWYRKEFS